MVSNLEQGERALRSVCCFFLTVVGKVELGGGKVSNLGKMLGQFDS